MRKIIDLVMDYDAFVMHAAVIDIDGQGIAFTADSGTGKTTRVLMWKNTFGKRVKVVNGDKPVLRMTDNGLYAFGSPWMGKEKMGENTCVPMKAVCFLQRGENVSLERMNPDEVIPRLFRQVVMPNNAERISVFMGLMERFVHTIPFYLLTCNMEKEKPEDIWAQISDDKPQRFAG